MARGDGPVRATLFFSFASSPADGLATEARRGGSSWTSDLFRYRVTKLTSAAASFTECALEIDYIEVLATNGPL